MSFNTRLFMVCHGVTDFYKQLVGDTRP